MNLTSKIIEDKVARQIQDEIDQEILHELSELSIAVKPKRLEPRDLKALDLKPGELYPSADGLAIVIRVWETTAPNSKQPLIQNTVWRSFDIGTSFGTARSLRIT